MKAKEIDYFARIVLAEREKSFQANPLPYKTNPATSSSLEGAGRNFSACWLGSLFSSPQVYYPICRYENQQASI